LLNSAIFRATNKCNIVKHYLIFRERVYDFSRNINMYYKCCTTLWTSKLHYRKDDRAFVVLNNFIVNRLE